MRRHDLHDGKALELVRSHVVVGARQAEAPLCQPRVENRQQVAQLVRVIVPSDNRVRRVREIAWWVNERGYDAQRLINACDALSRDATPLHRFAGSVARQESLLVQPLAM